MAANEQILPEGANINRPPGFDGEHYTFWKMRIRTYIRAQGYRLWQIIENGNLVPRTEAGVPKTEEQYTEGDWAMIEMNFKAMHILQSALTPKEYFRVSHLETAKEMWDALQVAHEGTSGVKDRRVETLVEEFHKIEMLEGEKIRDFEIRFTHLINNLAALGRKIEEKDQINKILKACKGDWHMKTTVIQELQGESMKSVTALFGSLAEYEPSLIAKREKEGQKKKSLALAVSERDRESEDDEEDMDEEDVALMVRKFKRFFKRKGRFNRAGSSFSKKENEKDKAPVCFECKKPGHFKAECPSLQRIKDKGKGKERYSGKKKAYVSSIWGDSSDEETSDNEEAANLCLVAQEEQFDNEVYDSEPSYSELQELFLEMREEFQKIAKEVCFLRKENKFLIKKISETPSISTSVSCEKTIEFGSLASEETQSSEKVQSTEASHSSEPILSIEKTKEASSDNCSNCENLLQEKERLSLALEKFSMGSSMLKIVLKSQKAFHNRHGIGYKPKPKKWVEPKEKSYMRYFRKSSENISPYSFCNYCNKKGHTQSQCFHKKNGPVNAYKWVPKGTYVAKVLTDQELSTNPKGPKRVWVPKSN